MFDAKKDIALHSPVEPVRSSEMLELLKQYIASLPVDQRGPAALRLSSQLLESTAFEIAGAVDSTCVGALIECAAKLSDPHVQAHDMVNSDTSFAKSILQ